MAVQRALIERLRRDFEAHADPARAPAMQAYMKSALPFRGLPAPARRALMAAAVRAHPCSDTPTLAHTMRSLWRGARFREERYAAMELARVGAHRRLFDLALLPVYESMIVEGAWWDICDDISGEAVGRLLHEHPAAMKPVVRRWARGDDLWLRRAAILSQRRLKQGFDPALLYETILPSIAPSPWAGEFFLRKGIGWALRERSYEAPHEVQAFCREYAARLSPLTVREALKAIARRRRA
jgi:3-methyladenine DNA glycosylase AlkD